MVLKLPRNHYNKHNREEADASVLAAILELSEARGYPPTYRELGAALGLAHSAIHSRVARLSQAGLVHEDPNTARTLRLSPAGHDALRSRSAAHIKSSGD